MPLAASALLTDLYQLTMLQGYLRAGMTETAAFEFFVRKMPADRSFLVAAGLEQALQFLEGFSFESDEIEWLAETGRFDEPVIDCLRTLQFEGDVYALPEGTIFFPDEPVIRIVAPMPVAQLVESRLINILQFQTLIASKAARMVLTAPDKLLVDFGFRRAHGAEAGLLAARASYIAGFAGSATVQAERDFGVPAYGTVAHSFVQAHDDETEAFLSFARSQPENAVLLIDTYDTVAGAEKVVALAPRLKEEGIAIRAVRLDSGDLADLSRKVRVIFDEGGLGDVRIFASGSIDEYALDSLISAGAPIDGYGIGTHLTTSADAPYLDCAYKLQEYAGAARRKRSTGKATWPGRKQVYRRFDVQDRMCGDTITLEGERQEGEPLLKCMMQGGKRLEEAQAASVIRARVLDSYGQLPQGLCRLQGSAPYEVKVAQGLKDLAARVDARTGG